MADLAYAVQTGNALALQRRIFRENRLKFRPSSAAEKVIVCGKNKHVKSEMLSNRKTGRQTKYCNPRCACAPRLMKWVQSVPQPKANMRDFERKNVQGCLYVFSIHVVSQKLYPLFFSSNVQLNETAKVFKHLEKQETEMRWKRKLETEMEQTTHQSLVQCFLYSMLRHYSCILLRNGYMTGFYESCALSFLLHCAL